MARDDDNDSQSDHSDNEEDETMQDAERGDGDDADADGDGENEDENDDNDEDDDGEDGLDDTPTRARPRNQNRQAHHAWSPLHNRRGHDKRDSDSRRLDVATNIIFEPRGAAPATPAGYKPAIRFEALGAATYDIVPTIAAPHSTSINAVTATPDMRWVFSGGSDGWVRKFNWIDTANGKSMLTVAQRHPFVDSVTKAGVLMSYWENEDILDKSVGGDEGPSLSPVYSLAVHHQALWLLSGTESGPINLMSVRHEEGKRITSLQKHTSAVSVMALSGDEQSVLSGSWDKTILDWDLNTAQVKRSFTGSGGQISSIEARPISNVPIPTKMPELPPPTLTNGTFSTNIEPRPSVPNGVNGVNGVNIKRNSKSDGMNMGSPGDSLFGGGNDDHDSLFGDDDGAGGADNPLDNFNADEDAFAQQLQNDLPQPPTNGLDNEGDFPMPDSSYALSDSQLPTLDFEQPPPFDPDMQSFDFSLDPDPKTEPSTQVQPETEPNPISFDAAINPTANTTNTTTSLPHSFDQPILPLPLDDPFTTQPSCTTQADHDPSSTSPHTFLSSSIDGSITLWDSRSPSFAMSTSTTTSPSTTSLPQTPNTPPWCLSATFSPDGNFIYAGRRNGTVDEYSVYRGFSSPRRSLKFPGGSGAVSAIRAMPNGRHLVVASYDILRLYDLRADEEVGGGGGIGGGMGGGGGYSKSKVPFLIVPGHRTGVISSLYLDPTCRFLISTGGNRGWEGASTEVLLGYEIGFGR